VTARSRARSPGSLQLPVRASRNPLEAPPASSTPILCFAATFQWPEPSPSPRNVEQHPGEVTYV
jgi:hypothetical protein